MDSSELNMDDLADLMKDDEINIEDLAGCMDDLSIEEIEDTVS